MRIAEAPQPAHHVPGRRIRSEARRPWIHQGTGRLGRILHQCTELVRESVGLYLTQRDAADAQRQALGALARLAALRDDVEARHGALPGSGLAALRSERDDELDQRHGNPT